jgi:hypothetical protein
MLAAAAAAALILVSAVLPGEAMAFKKCFPKDDYKVCNSMNGGIVLDGSGTAKCGNGDCVLAPDGEVYCSVYPGGTAALTRDGKAVCEYACAKGEEMRCLTVR